MTNRVIPVFNQVSPSVGSFAQCKIFWPGGKGWLIVSGTFTGATAKINVVAIPEQSPVTTVPSISPHPDFPSGITASGTYKFESPEGQISFASPTLAGGDSMSVSMDAIIVNW